MEDITTDFELNWPINNEKVPDEVLKCDLRQEEKHYFATYLGT